MLNTMLNELHEAKQEIWQFWSKCLLNLVIQYTTKTHCGWCKLSSLQINVFLIWATFLFHLVMFLYNLDIRLHWYVSVNTPKIIG